MNRVALLLLLLCSPLPAAIPPFSGCWVGEDNSGSGTMGDRSAVVYCDLDASAVSSNRMRISIGPADGQPADSSAAYLSAGWLRATTNTTRGGDTFDAGQLKTSILAPATTYYLSIEVSDTDGTTWSGELTCPVTCTDCDSGDDALFGDAGGGSSNLSCTENENPRFTTAAEDSLPVAPIAPSHTMEAATPDADDEEDPGDDCADIATARSDAKIDAEAGGTTERIIIDAGTTCPANMLIPNLTDGIIQFASTALSASPNLLPPPGARIDETFMAHMGRLSFDADDPSTWEDLGSPFASIIQYNTTGSNHEFLGLIIGPPDFTEVDKVSIAVEGADAGADTLTLASMPFAEGNVVLANLDGTGLTSWHGPAIACNISSLTLQLCASNGSTVRDIAGSYSAGGSIDLWPAQPIADHADCGDGEHCLTVTGHGMGEYAKLAITGNNSATEVTVGADPEDYQIDTTRAVLVRDSTDISCNGIWPVGATTATTITLTGADCDDASDGTVQVIDSVIVWGSDDDAVGSHRAKKVWHWLVEDPNTLRLVGSIADAAVAGGWVTWEAEKWGSWISGNTSGTNLRIDRTILGCRFPWRCEFATNLGLLDGQVIRDTMVMNSIWRRIDPVSGDEQNQVFPSNPGIIALYPGSSDDVRYLNNFVRGVMYGETATSKALSNFTFRQNLMWQYDSESSAHASFDHIAWKGGYMVELKSSNKALITGNYLKGQIQGFAPNAGFWGFSGPGWTNRDVELAYNTMERGANGILFNYYLDTACCDGTPPDEPTVRIHIHDNQILELSQDYNPAGNSGKALIWQDPVEDLVYERNIHSGANTTFGGEVSLAQKGQGAVIRKNVFEFSEGANASRIGFRGGFDSGTNIYPYVPVADDDGVAAMFAATFVRGVTADTTSEIDDNILIPCLESASIYASIAAFNASLSDDTDAVTITADELAPKNQIDDSNVSYTGIIGEAGTGNGVDDCLSRRNTVFQAGTWSPQPGYTDYVPDPRALSDAQGWTWDVPAIARSSTVAQFTIEAPNTDACAVDMAPTAGVSGYGDQWDGSPTIIRTTYSGEASQTQVIEVTGLSPNTEYVARVWCKEKLDVPAFTTLP